MSAFEEPEPTDEFTAESLQGEWIEQVPLQRVIEALKMSESARV